MPARIPPDLRPGRFAAILLDAGVSGGRSGLPTRRLEETSEQLGERISRQTWTDWTRGHLPDWARLPVIAETLGALGVRKPDRSLITLEDFEQAWKADKKHRSDEIRTPGYDTLKTGASPADLMLNMLEGLPGDQQRLACLVRFAQGLPKGQRAQFVLAMLDQGDNDSGDGTKGSSVR